MSNSLMMTTVCNQVDCTYTSKPYRYTAKPLMKKAQFLPVYLRSPQPPAATVVVTALGVTSSCSARNYDEVMNSQLALSLVVGQVDSPVKNLES